MNSFHKSMIVSFTINELTHIEFAVAAKYVCNSGWYEYMQKKFS